MNPQRTTRLFPAALLLAVAALTCLFPSPHATAAPPTDGVWPLHPRPEVVRSFDLPAKPWLPGHRGLDLAGSPGQPVLSATSGTITYSGPLAGRGVIVVTNGQSRTTYEPVIHSLPVGTAVTAGTPIARLSAAGTHCPPRACLHWGLRTATTYLNPLSLLATHPVRLLPQTTQRPPHAQPPPTTQPPPHAQAPPPAASRLPLAKPSGQHPLTAPSGSLPELSPAAPPPPLPRRSPDSVRQPAAQAQADGSAGGELTAGIVVGLAAAASAAGGLLIRRH